jgi:hypothetical protein
MMRRERSRTAYSVLCAALGRITLYAVRCTPYALCLGLTIQAAPRKTKAVVLVTVDGLRWQEMFGGIDPRLMNEKTAGMVEVSAAALRESLSKGTPEARREALLPFFWKELAPRGIVLGNLKKGSPMRVTNSFRVSYPGYSEILTGRAQDGVIKGNDEIRNPTPSILEFLRERLNLKRSQVALFASWNAFRYIAEHTPGSITINAGYEPADATASARAKELSVLQFAARTPWDEARHDYVTFELAMDYLRRERPRVLYISFDETDDWAHGRRYDRVLEAIQYFDHTLQTLWTTLQAMPEYRDQTTLVITCDHGRGDTLADFNSHGDKVAGADQVWLAIVGPDTPARGELTNTESYYQRDIAPTILELLGVPVSAYPGMQGRSIGVALKALN